MRSKSAHNANNRRNQSENKRFLLSLKNLLTKNIKLNVCKMYRMNFMLKQPESVDLVLRVIVRWDRVCHWLGEGCCLRILSVPSLPICRSLCDRSIAQTSLGRKLRVRVWMSTSARSSESEMGQIESIDFGFIPNMVTDRTICRSKQLTQQRRKINKNTHTHSSITESTKIIVAYAIGKPQRETETCDRSTHKTLTLYQAITIRIDATEIELPTVKRFG